MGRKASRNTKLPNFSPEKAEIEALKIELSYARTKVVDLETRNKDAENTIKIYSHKLKILEENRTNNLNEKYFSPAATASKLSTEMKSTPECSCQIRAQISRNTLNLKELEMKLSSEMQIISRKLDTFMNQSFTFSSTPETTACSLPVSSSSSAPSPSVPPSDSVFPGNLLQTEPSPLITPDHASQVDAGTSSASDSDINESDFNFSDVDLETSSEISLN